jgi:hypothetical protein
MITVGLYIKDEITLKYNRVELFDDEKISVNSSIQNINDISKVYTDFSQTFTVPANEINNIIFKNWYENSIDDGFDARRRKESYIELDTILYRNGKIQLESVDLKNNKPNRYKITFFGNLVSLKDTFNGLFLKDLTLDTTYDYTYSGATVKASILTTAASSDIMFPLISSDKVWSYGVGTTYDVSASATPIKYSDLFPAIKLSSIFNMIETQFGITFSGDFITTNKRFLNAYLWLKNSELFSLKSSTNLITWDAWASVNGFDVDLVNESFNNNGNAYYYQTSYITLTATVAGLTYNIHTYKNNIEVLKQTFISTTSPKAIGLTDFSYGGYDPLDIYTVKISAVIPITFNATLTLTSVEDDGSGGYLYFDDLVTKSSNQTTSTNKLPIKDYFPEIKIEDFFSGILKTFNLTCYSETSGNYILEQIEDYYNSGSIIDINKYIINDKLDISRSKSYNKIKFEFEKSENLISANFLSAYSRSFGDLYQDFKNDGSEYNIKLPFECLSFNKLSGNLIVGYALKYDLKQYIPKPILLYDLNTTALTSCPSFYFNDGSTTTSHTSYKLLSNETLIDSVYNSFVWGSEFSLLSTAIPNSLYSNYYQLYLENIFNQKARILKVNAILPISKLTTLKLKDRLIVKDKRYIINTMQTDLITGEINFELLTDFRNA